MTSKTILIADDDCDLADVLAMRCRQLGFTVLVAYDGLTASTMAAERPFDMILLDVNMPFGNGMDVCRTLAADENTACVPVVILTCRSDEETIRHCRLLGARYVLKSRDLWDGIEPLLLALLCETPQMTGSSRTSGRPDANPIAADPVEPSLAHSTGVDTSSYPGAEVL